MQHEKMKQSYETWYGQMYGLFTGPMYLFTFYLFIYIYISKLQLAGLMWNRWNSPLTHVDRVDPLEVRSPRSYKHPFPISFSSSSASDPGGVIGFELQTQLRLRRIELQRLK